MTTELIKELREANPYLENELTYIENLLRKSANALEAMQRELDAAKAEIGNVRRANLDCVDHFNAAMQELAERDQVIQQKDTALAECLSDLEGGFVRCESCGDQEDTATLDVVPIMREALSLQPTTSALDPYVTEKVKEKDAEIERLVLAIADHVTVRSEQHAEISKQAEALKHARALAIRAVDLLESYKLYGPLRADLEEFSAINALDKENDE